MEDKNIGLTLEHTHWVLSLEQIEDDTWAGSSTEVYTLEFDKPNSKTPLEGVSIESQALTRQVLIVQLALEAFRIDQLIGEEKLDAEEATDTTETA